MGVVAEALTGAVDDVLGTNTQDWYGDLVEYDPLIGLAEESVEPFDEAIFDTTREDLQNFQPDLGLSLESQIEYQSREMPAVVKRESDVELLTEEELEEQALLGKTKKNRLSVPLTGEGLATPTAGVGTPGGTPSGPAPSAGLQI